MADRLLATALTTGARTPAGRPTIGSGSITSSCLAPSAVRLWDQMMEYRPLGRLSMGVLGMFKRVVGEDSEVML